MNSFIRTGASTAMTATKFVSVQVSSLAKVCLAAACLAGCGEGAEGSCPELDGCGGDPTGTWRVGGVCQYEAVRPTQPLTIDDFQNAPPSPLTPTLTPPQPNPVLLQQSTSGDWCSSLVYPADQTITNANLWHDAPLLVDGQVIFDVTDHSYDATLVFSTVGFPAERNMTHFAPRCLVANGGSPTCAELAVGLTDYYAPLNTTPTPPASFQNIQCQPASDGGCDCTYSEYVVQVRDTGTWSVSGNVLSQSSDLRLFNGFEGQLQAPSDTTKATFCAGGGQLQMSGAEGSSLSGLQGLRTLTLNAM